MDQLPSELVVMILPYLSGPDFVHIRQTCKHFKDIADNLEITSKPALWRWYVLSDFPRPCVESLAPWLYTENRNDAFVWKMLYTSLRRMSLLCGVQLHCRHLLFESKAVNLATDVKFFDRHLFLFESTDQVKLVGLDETLWQWPPALCGEHTLKAKEAQRTTLYSMLVADMSQSSSALKLLNKGESLPPELVIQGKVKRPRKLKIPWIFSTLPETYDIGSGDVCISTWTNKILLFHIRHVFGENGISVYKEGISQKWIELSSNESSFKSLAFNEKRIVGICENRRICLIARKRGSEIPVDIFTYTLRDEAVKIKMLGDLVIVLYADGLLETGQIVTDKTNQMITNWQVLIERNDNYFLQQSNSIEDFAIHGQVFCAVSGKGKVFLSHFESLDHGSLKRNLHSPFRIPVESDGSLITRMSLDINEGLKFPDCAIQFMGVSEMLGIVAGAVVLMLCEMLVTLQRD